MRERGGYPLFVLLVVAVDHALEKRSRFISQGAGIKVDRQEYGQNKSNNHMQHIIKQKPADPKYGIGYFLREHECNPGNDQQGHPQVHGKNIGYFLEGIELLFFGDWKRMFFIFKNPYGVELKLFPEFRPKIFSPFPVIGAISGKHIANDKYTKIESQNDAANIVNGHRQPERDQAGFRSGIMKAKPGGEQ